MQHQLDENIGLLIPQEPEWDNSWSKVLKLQCLILMAPLALVGEAVFIAVCAIRMVMGVFPYANLEMITSSLKSIGGGLLLMLGTPFLMVLLPIVLLLVKCVSPLVDVLKKISYGFYLYVLEPMFDMCKSVFSHIVDFIQDQFTHHPYRILGMSSGLITALFAGGCATSASFAASVLLPIASVFGLASSSLALPVAITMCALMVAAVIVSAKFLIDKADEALESDRIFQPGMN